MKISADCEADATMPLDNIKTRMQKTGAESKYRNSLDCLVKVSGSQAMIHWKLVILKRVRLCEKKACRDYGAVQHLDWPDS